MSVALAPGQLAVSSRLLEAVTAPVVIIDRAGIVVSLNGAAARLFGLDAESASGLPATLFFGDGLRFAPGELHSSHGPHFRIMSAAGTRVMRFNTMSIHDEHGAELLVCTGTDVTEHIATMRRNLDLERQVRTLATNMPVVLWAVDARGVFTLLEGRALESFGTGREGFVGKSAWEVLERNQAVLDLLSRGLAGETFSATFELGGRQLDGWFEPIRDEAGEIAGLAGVAADITDRRRQEMVVAQSQKMESLGVMAGSVAHDFNNLLTAILGFAGLLKLSPALDPRDREQLYHIEQAARRGADIAGRLLSFSRGGLARFVPVDLREVVQETADLVGPTLKGDMRLAIHVPEAAVTVEGDGAQLQQAVLNIVLNARDALGDRGTIAVELGMRAGRAYLAISDDGPGMDESTRARIFEPFFTTKESGVGTGLGLAITYGVVRGHRGEIDCTSNPGDGTVFELRFPLLTTIAPVIPEADAGDGNLVLLVDDDELVRHSVSQTLSALGYNVVEVANGALAVELVRARPGRFAAILLDLVMPGMTGREVFHAISGIRPDLPVLVCTGYAADAHIDDAMKRSIAGLLQKPFTTERLADALHVVGARPSRGAEA
ncbi:MAG: response regulator [Dehalococcoidia bacterium]|nr:response regulator [Dehalococcoidia bacterium]